MNGSTCAGIFYSGPWEWILLSFIHSASARSKSLLLLDGYQNTTVVLPTTDKSVSSFQKVLLRDNTRLCTSYLRLSVSWLKTNTPFTRELSLTKAFSLFSLTWWCFCQTRSPLRDWKDVFKNKNKTPHLPLSVCSTYFPSFFAPCRPPVQLQLQRTDNPIDSSTDWCRAPVISLFGPNVTAAVFLEQLLSQIADDAFSWLSIKPGVNRG